MLAYAIDLWGLLSHPEFSEKFVAEATVLKKACLLPDKYPKMYEELAERVNQLVTDEYNVVYTQNMERYSKSMSHKPLMFRRFAPEDIIITSGSAQIRQNRSCYNSGIAIIDIQFDQPARFEGICAFKPAYDYAYNGCKIYMESGAFKSLETVMSMYMIYVRQEKDYALDRSF